VQNILTKTYNFSKQGKNFTKSMASSTLGGDMRKTKTLTVRITLIKLAAAVL
jgi:hypothetical protein